MSGLARVLGWHPSPGPIPDGDLTDAEIARIKALLATNVDETTDEWIDFKIPRPSTLLRMLDEITRGREVGP